MAREVKGLSAASDCPGTISQDINIFLPMKNFFPFISKGDEVSIVNAEYNDSNSLKCIETST